MSSSTSRSHPDSPSKTSRHGCARACLKCDSSALLDLTCPRRIALPLPFPPTEPSMPRTRRADVLIDVARTTAVHESPHSRPPACVHERGSTNACFDRHVPDPHGHPCHLPARACDGTGARRGSLARAGGRVDRPPALSCIQLILNNFQPGRMQKGWLPAWWPVSSLVGSGQWAARGRGPRGAWGREGHAVGREGSWWSRCTAVVGG